MATQQAPKNDSARTADEYGYEPVDEEDMVHGDRKAFKHVETGLVVAVRHQKRPTQMHDPMTSSTDTGYVAQVRGEDRQANICIQLADKAHAESEARAFMAAHPDGEFEIPLASEQPVGDAPIDWRDN